MMYLEGSITPVNLTINSTQDQKPSWSPDGGKIAFSANRDGNYEIYVMNSDGSSPVNFTNNPDIDNYPSWSSEGGKIAYNRNNNIYTVESDGSSSGTLLIQDAVEPSW